jgi:hypothetical protein
MVAQRDGGGYRCVVTATLVISPQDAEPIETSLGVLKRHAIHRGQLAELDWFFDLSEV